MYRVVAVLCINPAANANKIATTNITFLLEYGMIDLKKNIPITGNWNK